MLPIRTTTPIPLIVHAPETEAGTDELARRVAEVHADMVHDRLKRLQCPAKQKLVLLDAVIKTVKRGSRGQDR